MRIWWLNAPAIYLLSLAWTTFILVLSLMPGQDMPALPFDGFDKLAHLICYAILCLLWARSFSQLALRRAVLLAAAIALVYGIGIEFVQGRFIAGRVFDLWDATANGAGALLGIVIFPIIDRTFD